MRLFRKQEDGSLSEVKTNQRLTGLYDAVLVATRENGDGQYVADFMDGSVADFEVEDGEAQRMSRDLIRNVNLDDMPHRQVDVDATRRTTTSDIGLYGAMFSEGTREETQEEKAMPAVEEF
jgi:hypothetical protein